eukprot:365847-Chlamydomonas_euryale.AAC.13
MQVAHALYMSASGAVNTNARCSTNLHRTHSVSEPCASAAVPECRDVSCGAIPSANFCNGTQHEIYPGMYMPVRYGEDVYGKVVGCSCGACAGMRLLTPRLVLCSPVLCFCLWFRPLAHG